MLITDVSGSMQATDVRPTRLVAARIAAKRFVAKVPKTVNVGVMALSSKPRVLASPTRDRVADRRGARPARPRGGTGTGEAIQAADQHPAPPARRERQAPAGRPSSCSPTARDRQDRSRVAAPGGAQAAHPDLHRRAGHSPGHDHRPRPGDAGRHRDAPGAPDPQGMAQVARASGGKAYTAADAGKLSDVYKTWARCSGPRTRSARSRPASPAAGSHCCCSAPRCRCAGSAA
jgi:Ca-activated chloride channel family protein